MNSIRPKFFKILWSDYIAMLAGIFPIVGWILYLDSITLGLIPKAIKPSSPSEASNPEIMIVIALAFSVIFVPLFIYRIGKIYTHFSRSIQLTGTIDFIRAYKDRGRIEFCYTHNDVEHRGGNAVHLTKFARSLSAGQKVVLMVDAVRPEKALIRDLYT